MVPAAFNQGLGKIFSFVGACARSAQWFGHNYCQVQIRWWPELKGASASGQYPVFQLIQLHRFQRAYAIEEAAELEDRQIWVWGWKGVKAGLGLGLHHWQQTSRAPRLHIVIAKKKALQP